MQARAAMPAAKLCGSKWTCSACACPLPPRRDGRLYLRVDWMAQQLERFDLAAWLTPAVHESASPEAMQHTLDIIKVRASGLLVSNVEVAQAAVHACIQPGPSSWRVGGSQMMPHLLLQSPRPAPRPTTSGRPRRRAPSSCPGRCWMSSRGPPAHRSRACSTPPSEWLLSCS